MEGTLSATCLQEIQQKYVYEPYLLGCYSSSKPPSDEYEKCDLDHQDSYRVLMSSVEESIRTKKPRNPKIPRSDPLTPTQSLRNFVRMVSRSASSRLRRVSCCAFILAGYCSTNSVSIVEEFSRWRATATDFHGCAAPRSLLLHEMSSKTRAA